MFEPVKDKLGNIIVEGDQIVYAAKTVCGSARMEVGTVSRVNGRRLEPKITVKLKSGRSVTIAHMNRVVVFSSARNEILREHLSEYGKFIFDQRAADEA